MSKLSIVIPVYGRLDLLKGCVESLPQGVPVHVVDDFTPDAEERKAIKAFVHEKGLKYYKNDRNLGFPATVNKGVMRTNTPLVCILNSDVMLSPDALNILEKEFDDPDVGVAGPMLLFPQGSQFGPVGKVQHVGIVFSIQGKAEHLFVGWDPGNERVAHRRDDLQAVTGACLMTRTDLFRSLGGFSEVYGKGTYEDVEYCFLVRVKKFKVVCNPAAWGYHYVGQSVREGYPLNQNRRIFISRVGNMMRNDNYKYL